MSDWYHRSSQEYKEANSCRNASWDTCSNDNSSDITGGIGYDGYSWESVDAVTVGYSQCHYCGCMCIDFDMHSIGDDKVICDNCFDYLFEILHTLNRKKKRIIVITEKKKAKND